jgi:hypothetical protein
VTILLQVVSIVSIVASGVIFAVLLIDHMQGIKWAKQHPALNMRNEMRDHILCSLFYAAGLMGLVIVGLRLVGVLN